MRSGLPVEYPLRVEVQHLYPRELATAERIIALVNERVEVPLPRDLEVHGQHEHFVVGEQTLVDGLSEAEAVELRPELLLVVHGGEQG